jgi:hypothetical protein
MKSDTISNLRWLRGMLAEESFNPGEWLPAIAALDDVIAECELMRARIVSLEENATRMREYRFGLEGIATDGKGNPL